MYSSNTHGISAIVFVHAALFPLHAVAIVLSRPIIHKMGTSIFVGFSAIFNTWISLFFVTLQFYPQLLEFRRLSGSQGSLSPVSLGIRAMMLLLVAVVVPEPRDANVGGWGCSADVMLWLQDVV